MKQQRPPPGPYDTLRSHPLWGQVYDEAKGFWIAEGKPDGGCRGDPNRWARAVHVIYERLRIDVPCDDAEDVSSHKEPHPVLPPPTKKKNMVKRKAEKKALQKKKRVRAQQKDDKGYGKEKPDEEERIDQPQKKSRGQSAKKKGKVSHAASLGKMGRQLLPDQTVIAALSAAQAQANNGAVGDAFSAYMGTGSGGFAGQRVKKEEKKSGLNDRQAIFLNYLPEGTEPPSLVVAKRGGFAVVQGDLLDAHSAGGPTFEALHLGTLGKDETQPHWYKIGDSVTAKSSAGGPVDGTVVLGVFVGDANGTNFASVAQPVSTYVTVGASSGVRCFPLASISQSSTTTSIQVAPETLKKAMDSARSKYGVVVAPKKATFRATNQAHGGSRKHGNKGGFKAKVPKQGNMDLLQQLLREEKVVKLKETEAQAHRGLLEAKKLRLELGLSFDE